MTTNSATKEYDFLTGNVWHYVDDPYGDVIDDTDIFRWTGDTTEGHFIARSDTSISPGVNEGYSGEWYNDDLYTMHDWRHYEDTSASVTDQKFDANKDGTVTYNFSLGYKTGSIGWSYTAPDIYQYDESTTDYARWHWEYRKWGVTVGGSNKDTMNVGSEAYANNAPEDYDYLMWSEPRARFYGNHNNNHHWTSFNFGFIY